MYILFEMALVHSSREIQICGSDYETEVVRDFNVVINQRYRNKLAALLFRRTSRLLRFTLHSPTFVPWSWHLAICATMSGLSLQSTYKMVSGYEIPVVGFGVSKFLPFSIINVIIPSNLVMFAGLPDVCHCRHKFLLAITFTDDRFIDPPT